MLKTPNRVTIRVIFRLTPLHTANNNRISTAFSYYYETGWFLRNRNLHRSDGLGSSNTAGNVVDATNERTSVTEKNKTSQ